MDAGYHLAWARAVASGETFQEGPFFRAPLYPYFLALWTALSPGSTLLARLAQAVLGGVTAALTARLAASVAGRAAAWVAGGLVALSPVLVAFDAELLIPTLLVPLLLVALDLCVRWGGDDRPRKSASQQKPRDQSAADRAPQTLVPAPARLCPASPQPAMPPTPAWRPQNVHQAFH